MTTPPAGSAWSFLSRYDEKPERLVVGLMSGTSADAVDAALVRISGSERDTKADVLAFVAEPLAPKLRETVLAVSHGEGNAETVSLLSKALGHAFADAAEAVLRAAGVTASAVDAVASHGQTVSHTPGASPYPATLQIGEASAIAQRLGVPVVSDFRQADMTAGGQGAPLTPYADWCLLTHPKRARAVQNIGGIGNVTYLPADARPEQVLGFDTGPGNMLIDLAAEWASQGRQTYDLDGLMAAEGLQWLRLTGHDPDRWLARLLAHPFLAKAPPKSAGREEFGKAFWESLGDIRAAGLPPAAKVALMTLFTARSIADAYRRFLPSMPDEVIVGGGGARNPTLMRLLGELLAPAPVRTHEDAGIDSDAKEALAFAVLANETLLGKPANLPSVTGASRRVILGILTLP